MRPLDAGRAFGAVILDMDGLMLDTEAIGFRAWTRAARDFGWPMTDEDYFQLIGQNDRDASAALTAMWEARPGPHGSLQAISERAADYARAEPVTVKPGLRDLLGWARRERVPLAVGSSSSRSGIIAQLSRAGVVDAFDVIAGGDEIVHGKPAPDIFLLAASRLGREPAECVVIEDSDHGINAAFAAGMTPFLVPDSSIPRVVPADVRAKAYRTCASLTEVLGILRAALLPSGAPGAPGAPGAFRAAAWL